MSDGNDAEICVFCGQSNLIKNQEAMRFHQSTDRGYVFCTVTIPIATCSRCGRMSWDESAEAIMDEAVRREYDKLS